MQASWQPFDDAPLLNLENDKLGRQTIVNQLLRAINTVTGNEESSVIAVVGRWGSGKTTVVNAALTSLSSDIQITHFNPWSYSSADAAVAGFMRNIQELFGDEKNAKLRESFGRFLIQHSALGGLGGFAGADVGGALEHIGKLMSGESDPADQREKVRKLLQQAEQDILVIVDDLDRLEPAELLVTFRLVRQLGRLPFIHYVICFDETTLLDIIKRTGLSGKNDGRAREYLEKMVQARIEVSSPSDRRLIPVVSEMLGSFAEENGVTWDWTERERLLRAWSGGLEVYLDRPRNLKRLSAQLMIIWPELEARVDYVDLVLALVLHMFEPSLVARLRREPHVLSSLSSDAQERTRNRPHEGFESLKRGRMIRDTVSEPRPVHDFDPDRLDEDIRRLNAASDPSAAIVTLRVLLEDEITSPRPFAFSDPVHLERYLTLRSSPVDDLNPMIRLAIDQMTSLGIAEAPAELHSYPPDEILRSVAAFDAVEPIELETAVSLVCFIVGRVDETFPEGPLQFLLNDAQLLLVEQLNRATDVRAIRALEFIAAGDAAIALAAPILVNHSLPLKCRDEWWQMVLDGTSALLTNVRITRSEYGRGRAQKAILRELAERLGADRYEEFVSSTIGGLPADVSDEEIMRFAYWAREAGGATDLVRLASTTPRLAVAAEQCTITCTDTSVLKPLLVWTDGESLLKQVLAKHRPSNNVLLELCSSPFEEWEMLMVQHAYRSVEESLVRDGDDRWIATLVALCNVVPTEQLRDEMWSLIGRHDFLDPYDLANSLYSKGEGLAEVELGFGLLRLADWLTERPAIVLRLRGQGQTKAGQGDLIHLLDEAYGLRKVSRPTEAEGDTTAV
ncbi:AAA family ATPase [Nostocoides sp. F2B08]|uniref:KAP family P-loop NTPase fold protein n=1 Tax=Nostocoides sp. F2B08 TaxID=2653936 RepID=UPI001262BD0C|nr:P-loop NTPase fold protein [Tetrasphaera sp. F2B08]KAB7739767.1 AAA family ATPase [Tetrasphaera sp. F2B08]